MKRYNPVFLISLMVLGTAILLASGCGSSRKLSKTDISHFYSEYKYTDYRIVIFHLNDSVSRAYVSIPIENFSTVTDNEGGSVSGFRLDWALYKSFESVEVIDSSSALVSNARGADDPMEMLIDFDFRAAYPADYVLKTTLTDIYSKEKPTVGDFTEVNKQDRMSAQNFMIVDEDGLPLFSKQLEKGTQFGIRYNRPDAGKLTVRYYDRIFPVARPPFALDKDRVFRFAADSLFTVSLSSKGYSDLDVYDKEGIYHFQADTSMKQGYSVMVFHEGFPGITSPHQAIRPLRYLTSKPEFGKLFNYDDKKTAVDSFWLERASQDPERARSMIQRYYGRVEFANKHFSSHKVGWKTDRGIIYIIYGPPSYVYRRQGEEEWIYGEPGNPLSIEFDFYRVENPFTNNDLSLARSPVYKQSWYIAIENWRRN